MTLHLRHRFKIREIIRGATGGTVVLRECSFCGRLRETFLLYEWPVGSHLGDGE